MGRLSWACAVAIASASPAHAAGDAARGATLYESRCGACHSVQADRIGPHHAGIAGRRAGSVSGFDYSPALAKAGFAWDARSLERWIADPESVVPGQRMGFRVNDVGERADIVAFLLTLKP
jgi:cytochrome c